MEDVRKAIMEGKTAQGCLVTPYYFHMYVIYMHWGEEMEVPYPKEENVYSTSPKHSNFINLTPFLKLKFYPLLPPP